MPKHGCQSIFFSWLVILTIALISSNAFADADDALDRACTFQMKTSVFSLADALSHMTGMHVIIERPVSVFGFGGIITGEFEEMPLRDVFTAICEMFREMFNVPFTWAAYEDGDEMTIVMFPAEERGTWLWEPVDCSAMTSVTIPDLLAAVFPEESMRLVTYENPPPIMFVSREPGEERWLGEEIDLSDLGTVSLREALCFAMMRQETPNLIYLAECWGLGFRETEEGRSPIPEGDDLLEYRIANGQLLIKVRPSMDYPIYDYGLPDEMPVYDYDEVWGWMNELSSEETPASPETGGLRFL